MAVHNLCNSTVSGSDAYPDPGGSLMVQIHTQRYRQPHTHEIKIFLKNVFFKRDRKTVRKFSETEDPF